MKLMSHHHFSKWEREWAKWAVRLSLAAAAVDVMVKGQF